MRPTWRKLAGLSRNTRTRALGSPTLQMSYSPIATAPVRSPPSTAGISRYCAQSAGGVSRSCPDSTTALRPARLPHHQRRGLRHHRDVATLVVAQVFDLVGQLTHPRLQRLDLIG